MNYQETLDYLFTQLPMYQRVGSAAYKVDLANTHLLCEILDHPERNFKSIHIAGTNGKGSTSHMVASILQEAGYKVGLYTSPHLKDFRERIKINGEMIAEADVMTFVENHKVEFEAIDISFFEWTVGLAFDYFSKQDIDIAIIETGLGGRLDSTNIIEPELCAITNIGIDHTQFLGDTLELIAREKAGIIKRDTPVVIGESQKEIETVFHNKAKEMNAPIYFADKESYNVYATDLQGGYQQKNQKTCLKIIQILNENGWSISNDSIVNGLSKVVSNTGLLGRWQCLGESPLIICDTGHNKEGVEEVVAQFDSMTYDKLHIVFGVVNDKQIDEVLDLMPKTADYYFCKANIPRALSVELLSELAGSKGLIGKQYKSVNQALDAAKVFASKKDMIFIGGSTFVVAEVV